MSTTVKSHTIDTKYIRPIKIQAIAKKSTSYIKINLCIFTGFKPSNQHYLYVIFLFQFVMCPQKCPLVRVAISREHFLTLYFLFLKLRKISKVQQDI